jgi:hypothetical protein
MKRLSQGRKLPGQDSHMGPPEYEAGALTTETERHFLEVTPVKKKDNLTKQ